jgi:hypothetical protein
MNDDNNIHRILDDADKNSMVYWFPKIKDLDIPQPKTIIVEVPAQKDDFERAGDDIGYPLFMRTDHASAKHNWDDTCYVPSEKDLHDHIFTLMDETFMLPTTAIAFREFLKLNYKFKAFDGLPIAKERRYFIKDGKIQCHHHYWIKEAIRFWNWNKDIKEPANWREQLEELNREDKDEVKLLSKYALEVAGVLEGYWSVDFANGKDGTWYLIDCALGNDSFHHLDCKYCPQDQREHYGKRFEQEKKDASAIEKLGKV